MAIYVDGTEMLGGSVIQTSNVITGTTSTYNGSPTDNTWYDSVVTGQITPIFDDSSIIIHTHVMTQIGNENSYVGWNFRWKKVVGSTTTYPAIGPDDYNGGMTGGFGFFYESLHYSSSDNWARDNKLTSVDSDVDTTSAVTYTLQWATMLGTNDGVRIGGNAWGNFRWHLYFQEIGR
jgi:hypothetical protein